MASKYERDSKRQKLDESTGSTEERRRSSRQKTDQCTTYAKVCIFCDKSSKYIKNTRTREPLEQSCSMQSDVTLREIATQRMDSKILAITSRELVAAEARYHRSCYNNYTRQKKDSKKDSTETDSTETDSTETHSKEKSYAEIEAEAYGMLFDQ